MNKVIILTAGLIVFALYAYWDLSTFDGRCLGGVREFEERLPEECWDFVLKKAQRGDTNAAFTYTHNLEMIVEDELSRNNDTYGREGFFHSLAKLPSPHKEEYLYWVKNLAKNGNDYFLGQALRFCQSGVPTFNSSNIKIMFEDAKKKGLLSNTTIPAISTLNENINSLKQRFNNGEFSPCVNK